MSKNVTIHLDAPITGHGGNITKLVYRQPKWRDVMAVGEPYTVHASKDGERFVVENHEAIQHYAEACLVEPLEYDLVEGQVGLSDTLKVREVIMGFFLDAARAGAASKTSPKNSPSSSDGSQTPSAI